MNNTLPPFVWKLLGLTLIAFTLVSLTFVFNQNFQICLGSPCKQINVNTNPSDKTLRGFQTAQTPSQQMPDPTSTAFSQIQARVSEKWSGKFFENGGQTPVELDAELNLPAITGTWSNFVGQVSITGRVTNWNNLSLPVQSDLSSISHDNSSKVVVWSGMGNATGNIWSNGLYYCLMQNTTHMQCAAYEHQGANPFSFYLDLQGSGSSHFI